MSEYDPLAQLGLALLGALALCIAIGLLAGYHEIRDRIASRKETV